MAFHDDLLAQADHLASKERKRPKQASLRRAVSAAYYALFHLLIDDAVHFLVAGKQRDGLRRQLARAFEHGQMKQAARAFVAPSPSGNPWRSTLATAPSASLIAVAEAFIALQEQRHEADYDLSRTFTRSQVQARISRARAAFASWSLVRGTEEADAFLLALLVRGRA